MKSRIGPLPALLSWALVICLSNNTIAQHNGAHNGIRSDKVLRPTHEHENVLEPSFVAVIVSDIDTSIAWYSRHLDLTLQDRTDRADFGFSQANLSNAAVHVELIQIKGSISADQVASAFGAKSRLQGVFKFGFRTGDFDDWLQRWKEAGVNFRGEVVSDPTSGKRMIIALDPDGNRIQLFEK